jgi:hypothetical protein
MLATESWRPMAFGLKDVRRIREPICEPLWWGIRVLVHVDRDGVRIRDVEGSEIPGWDELRGAIEASAGGSEMVVDAYLLPALDDTTGAESFGNEDIPTPRQFARQFFVGNVRSQAREDAENSAARLVEIAPDEPAAIVAIDLLWLDGESLLDVPLGERKRLLDAVLTEHPLVRRTVHVRPPVETWYRQWRAFGFREFAVKDANSRYVPGGESDLWATAAIPRR